MQVFAGAYKCACSLLALCLVVSVRFSPVGVRVCVSSFVPICVWACPCVCLCVCVRVGVGVSVCVFARLGHSCCVYIRGGMLVWCSVARASFRWFVPAGNNIGNRTRTRPRQRGNSPPSLIVPASPVNSGLYSHPFLACHDRCQFDISHATQSLDAYSYHASRPSFNFNLTSPK